MSESEDTPTVKPSRSGDMIAATWRSKKGDPPPHDCGWELPTRVVVVLPGLIGDLPADAGVLVQCPRCHAHVAFPVSR